jgi:class III poly(R)-hydroxyalkanoic acid synthase PhaE subunit
MTTRGGVSMEKVAEFFDTWLDAQQKHIEQWMEESKKIQQSLLGAGGPAGSIKEGIGVVSDTVSKIFSSSNVYVKLGEIWLPLIKAIQEKGMNVDSYKDVLDPAQYREFMDRIFGFTSPEATKAFYEEAMKFLQALTTPAAGFAGPWTEAFQKSMKAMPAFVEGHPQSFINVFHTMFDAFDNTFGKWFHVPAVGKDREKVALLLRTCDDLAVNMAKNVEYRHVIYVTGLRAMEKVIETIAEKIRSNGDGISGFNEFLDLWIDVNEKTYLEVFQTEQFSKLQGEVLESSLSLRKHFFKLMELYLYDFPIALRSEMDDLYKTIYDLRKKVKGLEKQMETLSVKEVAA